MTYDPPSDDAEDPAAGGTGAKRAAGEPAAAGRTAAEPATAEPATAEPAATDPPAADRAAAGAPAPASSGLAEVVGRALIDERFRAQLFADRERAIGDLGLSAADHEALDSIPQAVMDEHAARFGSESAPPLEISVVIKGTF